MSPVIELTLPKVGYELEKNVFRDTENNLCKAIYMGIWLTCHEKITQSLGIISIHNSQHVMYSYCFFFQECFVMLSIICFHDIFTSVRRYFFFHLL